ncbi:DUF4236 domain-containing protein [Paraburkholderia sp. UCT31]|uniref:DUF4236 domain-containing protein n=1 Tax=Paraburkholderia sp. UCT31 TaxID=2615209 RepID=UPI001654EDBA|nr:DUF4236 domain-containing protein [Paraburkholderia sp. UCT31]MBC8737030.1 DUF4236 domain-containing protein [Paraburkholderia sp. UCT31]
MGLSYRKSIKAGPFRFNLSGSGVGVSVGVPGFRVGTGPRGNYVSLSAGGFRYRASLPSAAAPRARPAASDTDSPEQRRFVPSGSATVAPMAVIESAAIEQLSDSSADDLLEEIRRKNAMLPVWPWPLLIIAALCWMMTNSAEQGPLVIAAMLAAAVAVAVGTVWLYLWDVARRSTVLFYDLSGEVEHVYTAVLEAFEDINRCQGRWHLTAQGRVLDGRYHAGAGSIVNRKTVGTGIGPLGRIKCNVEVPFIKAGANTFYFCPDRVFVIGRSAVAAIGYESLELETNSTRFIESSPVPSDAQIVGHTWRFVNKNGTPDRRFNNNRRIPIAQYEELRMQSRSGINEVFQLSRVGAGHSFIETVRLLGKIARTTTTSGTRTASA